MFRVGDKLICNSVASTLTYNNIYTITAVGYNSIHLTNDNDYTLCFTILPDKYGYSYKTYFKSQKEDRNLKIIKLNGVN